MCNGTESIQQLLPCPAICGLEIKEEKERESVSVSVLSCSRLFNSPRESSYGSTVLKDMQHSLEWQFLIHYHGVQLTAVGCL